MVSFPETTAKLRGLASFIQEGCLGYGLACSEGKNERGESARAKRNAPVNKVNGMQINMDLRQVHATPSNVPNLPSLTIATITQEELEELKEDLKGFKMDFYRVGRLLAWSIALGVVVDITTSRLCVLILRAM